MHSILIIKKRCYVKGELYQEAGKKCSETSVIDIVIRRDN